jgi:hypothetical protein
VDSDAGIPKTKKDKGGLLSEPIVVKGGLFKGGVSKLNSLNYFSTVGIEGEVVVEDGAEVGEFIDFENGERKRGRGEGAGEDPGLTDACLTVSLGLFKDDDAGFGDGDGQIFEITGVLGSIEEALHIRVEMGDEAEVVDVKKETEKDHGVRVGEGKMRVVSLEGMHEIGDVQAPDEGGEAATLSQALETSASGKPWRMWYWRRWSWKYAILEVCDGKLSMQHSAHYLQYSPHCLHPFRTAWYRNDTVRSQDMERRRESRLLLCTDRDWRDGRGAGGGQDSRASKR